MTIEEKVERLEKEVEGLKMLVTTLAARIKRVTNFQIKREIPDTYVIQKGDTLAKLAEKYMSSFNLWTDIVEANPQKPQNEEWWLKLQVGETINLPQKWKLNI